jgi:uncharacterized protein (TIGR03435 family)
VLPCTLAPLKTAITRFRNLRGRIEACAGRPSIDATGLSGQFDAKLEWNPELAAFLTASNGASLSDLEARPREPFAKGKASDALERPLL